MTLIQYQSRYHDQIYQFWNHFGVRQGYAPLSLQEFNTLLLKHPYFSERYTFLLTENEQVCGFICGCAGDELVRGKERGYISCLLLAPQAENISNAMRLLAALEQTFIKEGRTEAVSNFFNPMRLPWIIPGTNGCQHNNAPGIAVDQPYYEWMKEFGYQDKARESAMYLNLSRFSMPEEIRIKEEKAAKEGYTIAWYDEAVHRNLDAMVDSMNNPMWSNEIPKAARQINMLVALKGNCVIGFTGPVYPEKTKRGYFAGIAVQSEHERHGLGTLLFYHLCQEEKAAGAEYMSLFTGEDNHAQKIYRQAGFTVRRTFAVMTKALG